MADKRSIAIRREAALAQIAEALAIDTEPGARDAAEADTILLERIAAGISQAEAELIAALAAPPDLPAAIRAATDEDLAGLSLSAAQIAKVRAAVGEG
jgi:hypothetical protein